MIRDPLGKTPARILRLIFPCNIGLLDFANPYDRKTPETFTGAYRHDAFNAAPDGPEWFLNGMGRLV